MKQEHKESRKYLQSLVATVKHGGGSIMLGDREVSQVRGKEPNSEYDHISWHIALALAANGWSDIPDGNLLQSESWAHIEATIHHSAGQ